MSVERIPYLPIPLVGFFHNSNVMFVLIFGGLSSPFIFFYSVMFASTDVALSVWFITALLILAFAFWIYMRDMDDIRYKAYKACLDASHKHNDVITRWNTMVPYMLVQEEDEHLLALQGKVLSIRERLEKMLVAWKEELKLSPMGRQKSIGTPSHILEGKQANLFYSELDQVAREVSLLGSTIEHPHGT